MRILSNNWIYKLGLMLILLLLLYSPKIDPIVARLAFNPHDLNFYGRSSLICSFIYHLVQYLVWPIFVLPILYFLWVKYSATTKARFDHARRFFIIVTLSLLIGPGLVVNVLFKEHWGRPRPTQVIKDKQIYAPIWQPNFAHRHGNSFPSGHASIGFFLGVPLFVLGYRRLGSIVSLLGGIIVGAVRILQGGHYVSDIICAGVFVWLCTYLVITCYDKYLFKSVKNV